MFERLKGKTALVTGSTSGIGLATARRLASQGCNIMLNGLGDAAEIERILADIEATHGVRVFFNGANMLKPDQIKDLFEDAEKRFGGVDVLMNNAGIQHPDRIEDFPHDKWEEVIAINLSAAFYCTQLAVPYMYAKGWGRIVNTASSHGLIASPARSAYVASKHGLVGLTKCVALEAAEHGVTCNAICPGYVLPSRLEHQIRARAADWGVDEAEAIKRFVGNKHATQQPTTPEQIADAVLYLCSDAAANLTGIALPIDGGWTAQ